MRLSNMNTPRHRRQGRGLHRAAAIGSLLVLGQSAYAETKAAAAEEGVQEMPERVMTIRSRSCGRKRSVPLLSRT